MFGDKRRQWGASRVNEMLNIYSLQNEYLSELGIGWL